VTTIRASLALDAQARLGESPCWDSRYGELVWVDIAAGRVHGWNPQTGSRWSADCGSTATFIVPRAYGGYVVGLELGVGVLDRDASSPELMCPIVATGSGLRMNDASCDPHGRLWAGTASTRGAARAGALYCIDPDWEINEVLCRVTTSNGIGWTADGRTMYYIDSAEGCVRAFVADEWIPFVEIDPRCGRPDGLSVDTEAGVWVALWGGGRIQRYRSDGSLDIAVTVDAALTTSCCFGGPNLDTLFITTAADSDRGAGGIYMARPGVRGLPAMPFAG
jgi:sugar lactone lactonase YvrE